VGEPKALYLEDLMVGQTFESGARAIDAEAIKQFAQQFDPQPFHLDETAAGRSFFGALAASGWHTAAVTMRLLTECVPLAGGLIGAGVESLRWPRPVRPGDVLRVRCEIKGLRVSASRPGLGLATLEATTLNQNDEPVQVLVSTVLAQRRA